MTRTRIIADVLACLGAISSEAGFHTDPAEVRRGIHLAEEMNQMPALTLFNERVETTDMTSATAERLVILHVWGAVKAVNDDYGELDNLASDCLKALADPALNPHWAKTSALNLEIYEGGASDPLGLFDLEVHITYETGLANL